MTKAFCVMGLLFCLVGCKQKNPTPNQTRAAQPSSSVSKGPKVPKSIRPKPPHIGLLPSNGGVLPQPQRLSPSVLRQSLAQRKQASALNTKGFRLYKKKQYAKAMKYFEQATKADPAYALAHWNLACTLGVLRKNKRNICRFRATQQRLLRHLGKAIKLAPTYKKKMQRDRDLDTIRGTLAYQKWLGHKPTQRSAVRHLAQSIRWFGPSVGMYGPTLKLQLDQRKKARLDVLNQKSLKWQRIQGRYSLRGRTIRLWLKQKVQGKQKITGKLGRDGKLRLPGLAVFTDNPSECSS